MAEYKITGPDGNTYQITAPEDATEDEILEYARRSMAQEKPRSKMAQFFGDGDWWRQQLGNIAQGASFGFSDELESMVTGVPHENLAAGRRQFQNDNPVSSAVAEIGGGFITGGGLLKTANKAAPKMTEKATRWAADTLPKWANYVVPGVIGGGLYGAGASDPGERAGGAAVGAAVGGGIPAVGYPVAKVAKGAYERVLKPIWHATTSSDSRTAKRIIQRELERAGLTPDDAMRALQESGDETALYDLSPFLQDLAYEAQSGTGPGRTIINNALDARQGGQQQRILDSAGQNLGAYADDARQFIQNIGKEKVRQAAPLYASAHSQNIINTEAFDALIKRVPKSAYKEARAIAEARGVNLDDLADVEKIDYLKRGLDTLIRRGVTNNSDAVSPALAREYTILKNEILDYVDEAVPDYKKARGIWAGASEIEDAAKFGREVFRQDAGDVADYVESLSQSEKIGFRYGVAQAFRDEVEKAGQTGNSANRLARSTKRQRLIRAAFGDDEEFEQFMTTLDREGSFTDTRSAVQGNSMTDARLQRRAERTGDLPQVGHQGVIDWGMNLFRPEDPMRNENVNRMVSEYLTGRSVPGWSPPMKPPRRAPPGLLTRPPRLPGPTGLLK